MNNQTFHPFFYILLQVLGIWVDGVFGIGFELMAVLIFSFGKKRSLENLFQQGVFVIAIEILIDLFCGDAEMIFETGFWILEEMRRVVLTWSWILEIGILFIFTKKAITFFIIKENSMENYFLFLFSFLKKKINVLNSATSKYYCFDIFDFFFNHSFHVFFLHIQIVFNISSPIKEQLICR